jgi:hypothetical protein
LIWLAGYRQLVLDLVIFDRSPGFRSEDSVDLTGIDSESPKKLSENAQASLRTIRWIMAILIQASLVRGLIS